MSCHSLYRRRMNVLVTGGCGFIGSHVVDALVARGDAVTVLDNLSSGRRDNLNPAATLVMGDVADAALVAQLVAQADGVIHLAAIASVAVCTEHWLEAHRTNLTGTVTVFDAARAKKTPIVYASSAAVYGDNPALPLTETAETEPRSAYGIDKLAGEKHARIGWEFHGIPSVGLRFFNVYGPRQDASSPYSGVISKFVAHARAGDALTFFGDGEQTRDFIYVGDVVALILAALAHGDGAHVFNGCTGRATSLKQLVDGVADALGRAATARHAPPRAGDIRHSLGDPSHASATLGFHATTHLADGLRQLVDRA